MVTDRGKKVSAEEWKARGELFDCPNPSHIYKVWRFLIEFRIAKKAWSSVNERGYLHTHAFGFYRIKTLDDLVAYRLILWRLSVIFGVI